MKRTRSPLRIVDQLHILFKVEKAKIAKMEQRQLCLKGMPLKIEEERRTEIKVFELAFARYFGYDQKTKKPGGSYLGQLREIPHSDQRLFEQSVFVDGMRLYPRPKGKVELPQYMKKAYAELFKIEQQQARVRFTTYKPTQTANSPIPPLDAAA